MRPPIIHNIQRENSIILKDAPIDCGRRITDGPTGQNTTPLNHENNPPKATDLSSETKPKSHHKP